jgi:hypothetical protein
MRPTLIHVAPHQYRHRHATQHHKAGDADGAESRERFFMLLL